MELDHQRLKLYEIAGNKYEDTEETLRYTLYQAFMQNGSRICLLRTKTNAKTNFAAVFGPF